MRSKDRKDLVSQVSDNTLRSRLGEWARNIVANEQKIKDGKGVTELFDTTKNTPAIIVASGPSLDKNIGLLREAKNKALIIAVDSSVQALQKIGVNPDVVFIADSKPRIKEFFVNVKSLKDIIVLIDAYVNPGVIEVVEKLKADIYWYNVFPSDKSMFCQIVPEQFTGPIGFLGSGGCVSSIAFAFASGGLKCDPVIMIGQDCSYSDPNKHHANDINESAEGFNFQERIEEDIYGNPVITNASLQTYAIWLEDMVTGNLANGMFINATEGGIVKQGWCIMPLRIVIDRYFKKEYNFRKMLLGEEDGTENSSDDTSEKKPATQKQKFTKRAKKVVAGIGSDGISKKFSAG